MTLNEKQVHIFVEGHVQGVGFRHYTLENARNLGVHGWVKNTLNDEVEIVAEGTQENLDQFIQRVRTGPSSAYVSNLRIDWQEATGKFNRFQVASTY